MVYIEGARQFQDAIGYSLEDNPNGVLIEEFIEGNEISVEVASYGGKHEVVQITEKIASQPPHFSEMGHHQPAALSNAVWSTIEEVVPRVIDAVSYSNGLSHIEMKYNDRGVYVVEINPRGGGDYISGVLTYLSSGVDFLAAAIEIALNTYEGKQALQKREPVCAGVYFLCKQSESNMPLFVLSNHENWIVEKHIDNLELCESFSNIDKKNYLIYQSDHRIGPVTPHVFLLNDFDAGQSLFTSFVTSRQQLAEAEAKQLYDSSRTIAYICGTEPKACATITPQGGVAMWGEAWLTPEEQQELQQAAERVRQSIKLKR